MDVTILDLHHRGVAHAIASFLVRGPSGALLVESGPSSTLPALESGLRASGLSIEDIGDVLLSHIHLDHGGAAGILAARGATIHVHEVGAPHLLSPEKLLASARRIFGDRMDELWGEFRPVPQESMRTYRGGEEVRIAGLTFRAHDTPGHARHHLVWEAEGALFAGDAACVRIPGASLVDAPAVPPELDVSLWTETIAKLRSLQATTLYLTHFGRFDDVDAHLGRAHEAVVRSAEAIHEWLQKGDDRDAILRAYEAWLAERARREGVPPESLEAYRAANPPYISVDGILRYWSKRSSS